MRQLLQILRNRLLKAERIAVLAVGSEFRGDDASGLLVAKKLLRKLGSLQGKVKIMLGETAPENFTGEIRAYNPTHLILLDCADCGEKPGTIRFIDKNNIGGLTFSTHMLPLKLMLDFLLRDLSFDLMIIGIQPEEVEFGKPVSLAVKKTVNSLSNLLCRELLQICH